MTRIGGGAFAGCSNLTSIHVDANNPNYTDIDGVLFNKAKTTLKQAPGALSGAYTIPDSVTSIGGSAFFDCSSLTSITIPDSVTRIGERVFENCSNLTCITIPSGVTSIGKYAFFDCSSLTSITIPDSVTSIGDSAFLRCSSLTSITIPDSVTSIGDSAFQGCSSLTSITIPDSVTSIGDQAFEDCDSLTSITIPDGVTSIGDHAFQGCSSLTSITIPDSVTSIGNHAFEGCPALLFYVVRDSYAHTYAKANKLPFKTTDGAASEILGSGSCGDNLTWQLDESGLLSITGTGKMMNGNLSWLDYRTTIRTVTIADGVTSIGNSAFEYCYNFTSITIPDSVTSIGDFAFEDCDSFTSITIPSGVTSIGDFAFEDCDSLTSITIPDGVTSIGDDAFSSCSSLTSIHVDANNPNYTDIDGVLLNKAKTTLIQAPGALSGAYTIPDSVTSIGNDAFSWCSNLTSITIPDGVTTIGWCAFSYCRSLTSITIPDVVTSIGQYAFQGCSSLTSIHVDANNPNYTDIDGVLFNKAKTTLIQAPGALSGTYAVPSGVTSIGYDAFRDCSSLTSISIPSGVTSIGDFAFEDCSGLASISIPDSVTSIGYAAFRDCSSLTSISIPSGVTSIGGEAFSGCSSLKSITIPDSVTSIGNSAFSWCDSLTGISIPSGVTSIGNLAFSNCGSLTGISIPDGVTSIGDSAFSYCRSLTSITILNPQCSIDDSSATFPSRATIYGYTGSTAEAYVAKYSRTFVALDSHTHTYATDYTIDTPATCTAPGEKSRHCTVCDARTDVTVIPKTAHDYSADWTVDVPAGCVTDGSKSHHCTVCGEKLDVTVIPATGTHSDADGDGKCDDCGKLFGAYWELDDATGELTVIGDGAVTDTDFSAVADKVRAVKIESSVTSLPDDAFAGFTDITVRCEAGSYASEYARTHGYRTDYINSAETADGKTVVKGVADGAVPSGAALTRTNVDASAVPAAAVEKLGKAPEFETVDLGMEKDGANIQPSGKVKITVSVAAGEKKYRVYRLNADSTITDMRAMQDGDSLTFEAEKLGRFIVQVRKHIPGVVTGEGETPMKKDLLRLQKYLAGWDVEVDEAAADCNGDGQISKADLLRLQKYLAGWDVKLGE